MPHRGDVSRGDDITVSVIGGGLITLCIVITAAAALHGAGTPVTSLNDLAPTLAPLLGDSSTSFSPTGFLAADYRQLTPHHLRRAAVTEIVKLRPN